MTDLDLSLTPAQWEHWDRHGWTLTAAPTEPCRTSSCNVPELGDTCAECHPSGVIPVPVTEPCPVCRGSRIDYAVTADGYVSFTCGHCSGSGVVPRTVGVVRPEVVTLDPKSPLYPLGSLPAGRVGTATVTPVPVVQFLSRGPGHEPDPPWTPCNEDYILPFPMVRTNHDNSLAMFHPGLGDNPTDVTALFATPPAPGTTVWRLDKENDR